MFCFACAFAAQVWFGVRFDVQLWRQFRVHILVWKWCLCWWGPCGVGIYEFMSSRVSLCVWTDHHYKAVTLPPAACSNSEECSKSYRHMSQCTSKAIAHGSIQTCNQGNFLTKERRTHEIACFSLVKVYLSMFQWRLPKSCKICRGRSGTFPKSREGQQLLAEEVREHVRLANATRRAIPGVLQFTFWQGIPRA